MSRNQQQSTRIETEDNILARNLCPEFAVRMADIRDVTVEIGKLRKSYN